MSQVLEQLEFSICSLGQDWSAEWLHNLLDRNSLVGELVLGGTTGLVNTRNNAFEQSRLTRRVQRLPCQLVVGRCICATVSCCPVFQTNQSLRAPAGDLKGGAKDLSAHEFGHDECLEAS